MWRSIAILLCIITGVLSITEEMQELIDTLHKTCVDESGVAEDAIENARKGNFPEDDKLKCYMKCIVDQMGCIDENGVFDIEATIAVLPDEFKEKGEKIITACGTKMGANPCDTVFLTNKCWYEQAPKDYFLA